MPDPRDREYARLLVETCVDVQSGWQVAVYGDVLGRPLIEEILRVLAEREAYPVLRVGFGGSFFAETPWLKHAPKELVETLAPLDLKVLAEADAVIAVVAPENTRTQTAVEPWRIQAVRAALQPAMRRMLTDEQPWVGCQYPTPALAQDAGMATQDYADFLYGACLLDWNAERERMKRYADRFEAADEARIVGPGTDLRLSISGRAMKVDAGGANMPGGEVFCSPVEDSAEGEITFAEFPAPYSGRDVVGIHLRFEGGTVVEASAEVNEQLLLDTLDSDEGARRVGELGIGCNPGITRHTRSTLFDEKIDGTVHIALGHGITEIGGTNVSTVHWDIVKDLRPEGRIELDGELVQENGRWLI